MVITITCPSCSSSFPVDPAKIPEGGVNARCSSCGDVFRVEKPVEPEPLPTLEEVAPPEPEVVAPEPTPPPLPDVVAAAPEPEVAEPLPGFDEPSMPEPPSAPELPSMPDVVPEPVAETPAVDPFKEAAPFEAAPAAAEPAPEPEPAAAKPAVQGFTFGKRDPTDKARRLARVLVSDMIMYNAERHQTALAAGTLVQDFEEEIDKSWKEYVEQVGPDLANGEGRGFWTQALNDILAKGQEVF
jgi:predicted Zn finger-like uncharacterized protein